MSPVHHAELINDAPNNETPLVGSVFLHPCLPRLVQVFLSVFPIISVSVDSRKMKLNFVLLTCSKSGRREAPYSLLTANRRLRPFEGSRFSQLAASREIYLASEPRLEFTLSVDSCFLLSEVMNGRGVVWASLTIEGEAESGA
jgi:hypothetical protein